MARCALTLLLILCFRAPLVAQSRADSGQVAAVSGTIVVPAPPPEPADTALAGEPLIERTVSGALVGAVTGAALSAQDSDCSPSGAAAGAITGGILGAIRAAFNWNPFDRQVRDPSDTRGVEAPFPFDGVNCERAEHD
jgi:hypothetical protein